MFLFSFVEKWALRPAPLAFLLSCKSKLWVCLLTSALLMFVKELIQLWWKLLDWNEGSTGILMFFASLFKINEPDWDFLWW